MIPVRSTRSGNPLQVFQVFVVINLWCRRPVSDHRQLSLPLSCPCRGPQSSHLYLRLRSGRALGQVTRTRKNALPPKYGRDSGEQKEEEEKKKKRCLKPMRESSFGGGEDRSCSHLLRLVRELTIRGQRPVKVLIVYGGQPCCMCPPRAL